MIAQSKFPPNTFRQGSNPWCIHVSLGTALFPFTNLPVQNIVDATLRCWPSAQGQSGYDKVASIFNDSVEPLFVDIRSRVRLERRGDVIGLDALLQNESATAIVALSFSNRQRGHHSVCVSYDGTSFALRDSAMQGSSNPDAVGASVAEALTHVPMNGDPGEVMVFRAA